MPAPIIAMDTETLGLRLSDPIWEFAGIRRDPDGATSTMHMFIAHDPAARSGMPDRFRTDIEARYDPDAAVSPNYAAAEIFKFTSNFGTGRPHIIGCVPNFDTERLALLLAAHGYKPEWHHHLVDAEVLGVAWLTARAQLGHYPDGMTRQDVQDLCSLPYSSDDVSRAVGIDPPGPGVRHTAMGDARWALALYDKVTGSTAPDDAVGTVSNVVDVIGGEADRLYTDWHRAMLHGTAESVRNARSTYESFIRKNLEFFAEHGHDTHLETAQRLSGPATAAAEATS